MSTGCFLETRRQTAMACAQRSAKSSIHNPIITFSTLARHQPILNKKRKMKNSYSPLPLVLALAAKILPTYDKIALIQTSQMSINKPD